MKYVIYAAVGALALWAVWYLLRRLGRLLRGGGCCADCAGCALRARCAAKEKGSGQDG